MANGPGTDPFGAAGTNVDQAKKTALEALATSGTRGLANFNTADERITGLQDESLGRIDSLSGMIGGSERGAQERSQRVGDQFGRRLADVATSRDIFQQDTARREGAFGNAMSLLQQSIPLVKAQAQQQLGGVGGAGGDIDDVISSARGRALREQEALPGLIGGAEEDLAGLQTQIQKPATQAASLDQSIAVFEDDMEKLQGQLASAERDIPIISDVTDLFRGVTGDSSKIREDRIADIKQKIQNTQRNINIAAKQREELQQEATEKKEELAPNLAAAEQNLAALRAQEGLGVDDRARAIAQAAGIPADLAYGKIDAGDFQAGERSTATADERSLIKESNLNDLTQLRQIQSDDRYITAVKALDTAITGGESLEEILQDAREIFLTGDNPNPAAFRVFESIASRSAAGATEQGRAKRAAEERDEEES